MRFDLIHLVVYIVEVYSFFIPFDQGNDFSLKNGTRFDWRSRGQHVKWLSNPLWTRKGSYLEEKGNTTLDWLSGGQHFKWPCGCLLFFLKYLSCICATLKCPPKDICIFSWYGSLKTAERRFNTRVPFQISESAASIESTSSSVAKTA